MRELLLVVHVLAAAAWIGGGFFALTSFSGLARQIGLKQVGALDEAVGSKYFGTAVGLLLLSGIGLVLTTDSVGWGDAFVLIGIAVVVVDGALEGTVWGPRMKKVYETEDMGAFRRLLRMNGLVSTLLMVLAVWAMVVKLGS